MSAKKKFDHYDYDYIIKGKPYKRKQVVDMVLECLKGGKKTIEQMKDEVGLSQQNMDTIMSFLRDNDLITNTKLREKGKYLYKSNSDCLLAELLYPSAQEVQKSFKVKGRTKRKVEDAPVTSEGRKDGVTYGESHYDSLDW